MNKENESINKYQQSEAFDDLENDLDSYLKENENSEAIEVDTPKDNQSPVKTATKNKQNIEQSYFNQLSLIHITSALMFIGLSLLFIIFISSGVFTSQLPVILFHNKKSLFISLAVGFLIGLLLLLINTLTVAKPKSNLVSDEAFIATVKKNIKTRSKYLQLGVIIAVTTLIAFIVLFFKYSSI